MGIFNDVAGIADFLKKVVSGKGMDAFRPAVNKAIKMITDANGLVDLETGKTKSGVDKAVAGVLDAVGRQFTSTNNPVAESVFNSDDSGIYLSKDLTSKMKDNINYNKDKLGTIDSGSFMGEYKASSIQFCVDILKNLKNYNKQFAVFTDYKVLKIFNKRVKFKEIWDARKNMDKSLREMLSIIKKYTNGGKYTFKTIHDSVISEMIDVGEGVTLETKGVDKQVANDIFTQALNYLKEFEDGVPSETATYFDESQKKEVRVRHILLRSYHELTNNSPDLDDDVRSKIINSKQLTDGITIAPKQGGDKDRGPVEVNCANDISGREKYQGFKQCLAKAREILKPFKEMSEIIKNNCTVKPPLMGDYALDLEKCFKYTMENLDKAIYLGAKNKVLNPDKVLDKQKDGEAVVETELGTIGVNLKQVLGEDYYNENKSKWKKREEVIGKSIDKNLLRDMAKAYSDAKKVYDKLKKLQKKYFPKKEDRKTDLSNLIVTLPSKSAEKNEKKYKIDEQFDQVKTLQQDALSTVGKTAEKSQRVALALRKLLKLVDACKQCEREYENHKKGLVQKRDEILLLVKQHLKQSSEHKKELLKTEGITKEQRDAIKKEYRSLPSFPYTYLKTPEKYAENKKKMEDFLKKKTPADFVR